MRLGDKIVALTFVKRSALPVATHGKTAAPTVAITEMGQIQLSKLCSEFLNKASTLVMAFDGTIAYLFRPTAKAVAKLGQEYHCKLNYPKQKEGQPEKHGCTFSGATVLRHANEFGASGLYDFKASGNQSFPATLDEKNGCITFTLPVGAIARRPFTPRKKKAPATNANPGEVVGQPVRQDEEIVLDAA